MRKIHNQGIRKLYKQNQSYAVTLPIALVRKLRWQEGQNLTIEQKGKSLVIKDWEK